MIGRPTKYFFQIENEKYWLFKIGVFSWSGKKFKHNNDFIEAVTQLQVNLLTIKLLNAIKMFLKPFFAQVSLVRPVLTFSRCPDFCSNDTWLKRTFVLAKWQNCSRVGPSIVALGKFFHLLLFFEVTEIEQFIRMIKFSRNLFIAINFILYWQLVIL